MCTVGETVNWCSHYRKQYWGEVPQNIKIKPPYDSAIPLLGIYPKETKTLAWGDISTLVFISALYITAKTWE